MGDFFGVLPSFLTTLLGDFFLNLSLPDLDVPGWGSRYGSSVDGKVGAVEVASGLKTSSTVVILLGVSGSIPDIIVDDDSDGGIEAVEAADVLARLPPLGGS